MTTDLTIEQLEALLEGISPEGEFLDIYTCEASFIANENDQKLAEAAPAMAHQLIRVMRSKEKSDIDTLNLHGYIEELLEEIAQLKARIAELEGEAK